MQDQLNKIASESLALMRVGKIRRPRTIADMGINVSPMSDRVDQWWADLAKYCGVFWSLSIKWEMESKGHIYFHCMGGAGTRLSVLLLSGGAPGTLNVSMDMTKSGKMKTVKFKTSDVQSIRDIVHRIDKESLDYGRQN